MTPETKKNSKTLVYSNQRSAFQPDYRYSNPRLFDGVPKAGITKVIIMGSWPIVEKAYRAARVEVVLADAAGKFISGEAPVPLPNAPLPAPSPSPIPNATGTPATAYLRTAETRIDQAAVEIPADWKGLHWVALRKLAAQVTDLPVINKDEAVAAIEAELARRAKGAQ